MRDLLENHPSGEQRACHDVFLEVFANLWVSPLEGLEPYWIPDFFGDRSGTSQDERVELVSKFCRFEPQPECRLKQEHRPNRFEISEDHCLVKIVNSLDAREI